MSQFDRNPNSYPDNPEESGSRRALMTVGSNVPVTNPFGVGVTSPPTDIVRGGMDKTWLLNSLRRRWLLATCMGLLVGSTLAALLYFLVVPETNRAVAQYEVKSSQSTLMQAANPMEARTFDIFKATQIAYIKSPYVLNAALGADNRRAFNSSFFSGVDEDDRLQYLAERLRANFPENGELLQISLSGDEDPEELKAIVDAVSKAYNQEVVFREQTEQLRPMGLLKTALTALDAEIRGKLTTYQTLLKDSGSSKAYEGFDPETKLMLDEVTNLQKSKTDAETQLAQAQMQFQIMQQQLLDPALVDQMIEEQLQNDPQMNQLLQQQMAYESYVSTLRSTVKNGQSPEIKRYERMRDQVSQQIAQYKQQMKGQLAGAQANAPNPMMTRIVSEFGITQGMLKNKIAGYEQRMGELQDELLEKANIDTDLMIKETELERLQEVQKDIAINIQKLQVESNAPERIRPIGVTEGVADVQIIPGMNEVMRYAITTIGGLGGFLLAALGIAYMEFTNRRLNGPEQMDEGLGIRVVGTLPSLSGRGALDPSQPIVAQLTEGIDSVRTALMHESTTKKRQIVLITSPATLEGRTTVASQLAASLARAGRRTLLVDGDLRSPSLHELFEVPLEDGFSEVLRAEIDVADVIRPTYTEGLWLLTAGYCDAGAVHALATDQVQPIFAKLRADYDFIIIDGAPVLGLSDSLLFGQHVDGAILSVLRDFSQVHKIQQAADLLTSVGVRMIGAVVNGVKTRADRRVTHLQVTPPKQSTKQIAAASATTAAAGGAATAVAEDEVTELDDFDLDSLDK